MSTGRLTAFATLRLTCKSRRRTVADIPKVGSRNFSGWVRKAVMRAQADLSGGARRIQRSCEFRGVPFEPRQRAIEPW